MASSIRFQSAEYLNEKLDKRAPDTFKAIFGKPQLQVHRLLRTGTTGPAKRFEFVRNQDAGDISQIRVLEKANDISQIFIIRQDRSWTTLNISCELLQDLCSVYGIFSHFWKVVFAFRTKYQENEFEFPRFRSLRTFSNSLEEVQESTYVLRRVELHHRKLGNGQSPWSIRQTAVYHRLIYDFKQSDPSRTPMKCSRSAFLLIAPSKSIERQLSKSLESGVSDDRPFAPWALHRILVAESLEGWMDYMASLEANIKEQSNRLVIAQLGDGREDQNFSSLEGLGISIDDRQNLKLVEDSVIELQIIVSTMLNTIIRIRKECSKSCKRYHVGENCDCEPIIEEFDEYAQEVELYIERAKSLKESVKSTIKLLSDLLSYESQAALKDIAHQSRQESKSMHKLTERGTKDAAAVKVLTIIGLIYLPTTMVLNFFSTQFVQSSDTGNMEVSGEAWLLAALAIPLTALTFGIWQAWVRFTNPPLADARRKCNFLRPWIRTNVLFLFLYRKTKQQSGLEAGFGDKKFQSG